ncbi:hypothetical protein H6G94_02635 [Nostoc punctiforme FACHB-252]|uniref:Uncharacterized protein n=2 Tax=Nostoc TaxID=1177 RepID=A0ABR8H2Y1_NOSPU|nr:hypothetical protein [Nostoc sp. 2RC]MBD2610181.1 hypothetical protein [Nostoc punctiforme FACHB-252]
MYSKKGLQKVAEVLSFSTFIVSLSLPVLAAEADAQPLSWNLSRDIMLGIGKTNPTRTWTFMKAQTIHNPGSYQLLEQFASPCRNYVGVLLTGIRCWQRVTTPSAFIPYFGGVYSNASLPIPDSLIGLTGLAIAHPTVTNAVVLRWTSPIQGKVSVSGRTAPMGACGNGIKWFLDRENSNLLSGSTNSFAGQASSFVKSDIPVAVGSSLFFIIDSNGEESCDTTTLDLLIVAQN